MIHFYDSASAESVPSGVYAAVYINGDFAWSEHDINRMARVFRITVEPEAHWATQARCVDIEAGDVNPDDAMQFLIARHKRNGDATAYCDRSTLPHVQENVRLAKIQVRYWVATLDGTQDVTGAWAVQYQGGIHSAFDLSVLHGVNDFRQP